MIAQVQAYEFQGQLYTSQFELMKAMQEYLEAVFNSRYVADFTEDEFEILKDFVELAESVR